MLYVMFLIDWKLLSAASLYLFVQPSETKFDQQEEEEEVCFLSSERFAD